MRTKFAILLTIAVLIATVYAAGASGVGPTVGSSPNPDTTRAPMAGYKGQPSGRPDLRPPIQGMPPTGAENGRPQMPPLPSKPAVPQPFGPHEAPALDPTRAPEGVFQQVPEGGSPEDAALWRTRADYPSSGVYRGLSGAWEQQADSSFMYAIGGQRDFEYSNECYRYDSRTNTWATLASLPIPCSNEQAVYWQDNGVGEDSSGVFTLGFYNGYYAGEDVPILVEIQE